MSVTDLEPGQPTDQEWIQGLRADDPRALRSLMCSYWAPLVGFAGRILSGTSDPQDVVQGVFVRLWARREDLGEEGSLRAFLYTMVRNASLDELRKAGRRSRAESDPLPSSAPPVTPYEDVQGAELQRAAVAAVHRLPVKRQEVFRLIREEGMSYQEAAQVLGLSPQTVANHMSLALADLRVALKPFLPGPSDANSLGIVSTEEPFSKG
jgi:RNA polymerase sigma-70 factor (ECF subfamily)